MRIIEITAEHFDKFDGLSTATIGEYAIVKGRHVCSVEATLEDAEETLEDLVLSSSNMFEASEVEYPKTDGDYEDDYEDDEDDDYAVGFGDYEDDYEDDEDDDYAVGFGDYDDDYEDDS